MITRTSIIVYTIAIAFLWILTIAFPCLLWYFESKFDIIANAHNPTYAFFVLVGTTIVYCLIVIPGTVGDTRRVLYRWYKYKNNIDRE